MFNNRTLIAIALVIMLGAFAGANFCFAEESPAQPLITSETTPCEHTGFVMQTDWRASKCYSGNLFLSSDNVRDDSNVGGIGFIAGNNLELSGTYEYGFHAGNLVKISGTYDKDIFVAGSTVIIDQEAQIGGNLYVAGSAIVVSAPVENLYAIGSSLEINANIAGDVYTSVGRITLAEDAKIGGTIKYAANSTVSGLEGKVGNTEVYTVEGASPSFVTKLTDVAFNACSLAVISLLLAFLTPKFLAKIHQKSQSDTFAVGVLDTLKGIAILMGIPLLAIVLLLSLLGVPVAIVLIMFFVIGILLTTPVVGYYLGCRILRKFQKPSKWNEFLRGVLGVSIIQILSAVPMIGGFVSFVVLIWGLGILWQILIFRDKQKISRSARKTA